MSASAPLRLLTTREAARHCRVSVSGLKKWIRSGHLAATRTPGGHWRIPTAEFQRFLDQHRLPPYSVEPSQPKSRILIVDDDPSIRNLFTDFLKEDPRGYEIETAEDGYEALIKIGAFKPTILLLDVMMPRVDGIEVCRRLKAQPATQNIRIIGITGYPHTIPALLKAGAEACFEKPLNALKVLQTVNRILVYPSTVGVH